MTATTPKSSTELAAAFKSEAKRLLEEYKVPGITLGLLTPDGDHFVSLGVTSIENPLPITHDTIFQIGSTTKTLTSLTCSVLVEQGKLDLNVPVRTYLPEFKLTDESVAARVTVHDLLTHQGGFQGDLFEETGDGDDAVAKGLDALAQSPQVVPLRGHWSYNNAGFFVAGRVIEVVTGKTYEAAVTELVLTPLGMDHTLFFPSQIMTYRYATGHNKVNDEMVVQRPWMMMRSAAPAGSSCSSTVSDMAKYAHYIMSGTMPEPSAAAENSTDEKAEKPEVPTLSGMNRTHLWKPVRPIGVGINAFPGEEGQIGQSWFIDEYESATIISHGGTTFGHQSDFWVSPDRKVGFIAMTNASNGHAMNRRLGEWVKREVLGLVKPEREEVKLDEGALTAFAGEYDVIGQPYTIGAKVEGGKLMLVLPNPNTGGTEEMSVRFIAPERAAVAGGDADGIGVEFLTKGGEVEFMRFGARLYPRLQLGAAQQPPVTAAL
ncbi:class A beta-lactamase-related serine hydrolase (plasmid) [Deinococcus psychrotolerans]|uniref:Class A beta-lactamase-related serine hydrolase n=1 Tax=Deinococcus psychrotolerans TaxID=2489213 RepID=A0A3G8YU02_9DEIO|nr:serine hydrolase domain-containing protein [Deinococcus psychrotolerans]AZI44716.1 class A beta-lactamase-related serine hydrolase [Deinococcus psychrotolerans]